MEAKDRKIIQEEILRKFPGTDPALDIDWQMIEISFKAGIRGVVDLIEEELKQEHHFLYKDALRNIKAKLKERGLG